MLITGKLRSVLFRPILGLSNPPLTLGSQVCGGWRTTNNLYKLEWPEQLDSLSTCCQPQEAKPNALKSPMTEAAHKVTVIF